MFRDLHGKHDGEEVCGHGISRQPFEILLYLPVQRERVQKSACMPVLSFGPVNHFRILTVFEPAIVIRDSYAMIFVDHQAFGGVRNRGRIGLQRKCEDRLAGKFCYSDCGSPRRTSIPKSSIREFVSSYTIAP